MEWGGEGGVWGGGGGGGGTSVVQYKGKEKQPPNKLQGLISTVLS